MESTSETVSNTSTEKSQCAGEEFEPSNPSNEITETITDNKIVEKESENVEEKEDKSCKVDEQNDDERENSNTENEETASSSTEQEEITKCNGNSVNEKLIENESESLKSTQEDVPCTTTIVMTPPTPTTEKDQVDKGEVQKEKSSEAEENDKSEEHEEMSEEESSEEELQVKEEVEKTIANEKETPKENITNEQIKRSETPQQTECKEETVVDAPPAAANSNKSSMQSKQANLNNTLKDIISTIDSNIIAEENIAALKEKELELIKKQQELAKEIQKQQLLAQKLANENQIKQQQINNNKFKDENNENIIFHNTYQPINNVTKYSTYEENQDENVYTRRSETFESRESANVSKKIDLHKIFTPATDAEEILPKNRKLYASSAFYSPTLHPTVEDQIELARRISHSLSDISNQQSRGQSMYVNRKKRSVKWVHEGCGQEESIKTSLESLNQSESNNEENTNNISHLDKVPLKFLMNPCGQMRDINSLQESINTETGLLSPDVSVEVMTALQMQKGKGAELFAKRRKISEKWVVDENNIGAQSPSGLPDYHKNHQQPKQSTSPSILPAYTDTAKQRVQLNLHQDQLIEKYAKPGLKVVQTPWEAALNSGSASTAFVEEQKLSPYSTSTLTRSPTPQTYNVSQGLIHQPNLSTVAEDAHQKYQISTSNQLPKVQSDRQQYVSSTNSQRELAYKPSIPQGWKAPSMSLPKEVALETQTDKIHSAVNDAAKSCEEFNTKDETELVNLIADMKESKLKKVFQPESNQEEFLSIKTHQFVNHLVKSPELRVSPIPIETQIIYDNAIQELYVKQKKKEKDDNFQFPNELNNEKYDDNNNESEIKVNVRKQLQLYEHLQQQFAKQMQQEQLLLKKREALKLKAMKSYKKNIKNDSINISARNVQTSETCNQAKTDESKETEYIQVPIKELILNLENQIQQEDKSNGVTNGIPTTSHRKARYKSSELHDEDLYMPKEIPIQSYAVPPVTPILSSESPYSSTVNYNTEPSRTYNTSNVVSPASYLVPETKRPSSVCNTFPVAKPHQQGFSSIYGSTQPPKQQYLAPESYQTVPQNSNQNVPQVSFSPSPLPYDKLAKFENPSTDNARNITSPTCNYQLNSRSNIVRNTSPAPFAASYHRPCTPSSDAYNCGGSPSNFPQPVSSYGRNTQSNITSNQILNAPTYNSSARGWGCSDNNSGHRSYRNQNFSPRRYPNVVNAASVPYTDF